LSCCAAPTSWKPQKAWWLTPSYAQECASPMKSAADECPFAENQSPLVEPGFDRM
jgi:hypothetical protein